MSVEVSNRTEWDLDVTKLVAPIPFCLEQFHVSPAVGANLMIVNMMTMTDLHIRWVDLPGPIDMLSFPIDELIPGQEGQPSAGGVLGDVVLCPGVAAEQAHDAGHSVVGEMLLLMVHDLLHLLGFDHVTEEGEKTMLTLQQRLLLSSLAQG